MVGHRGWHWVLGVGARGPVSYLVSPDPYWTLLLPHHLTHLVPRLLMCGSRVALTMGLWRQYDRNNRSTTCVALLMVVCRHSAVVAGGGCRLSWLSLVVDLEASTSAR